MGRLRVVVVDDERPARRFLTKLLDGLADVEMAGEAASGDVDENYHEPRGITSGGSVMQREFRDQVRSNDDWSWNLNVNAPARLGAADQAAVTGGRVDTYDDSGVSGGLDLGADQAAVTGRLGVVYKLTLMLSVLRHDGQRLHAGADPLADLQRQRPATMPKPRSCSRAASRAAGSPDGCS